MTYEEARAFINKSNQYGCIPGLETIAELLNRLGNPQEQLKVIHVAGTNGKGSTCAFLATILATSGYQVGRYISPAVFSYRERIQIVKPSTSSRSRSLKSDENNDDVNIAEEIMANKIMADEFKVDETKDDVISNDMIDSMFDDTANHDKEFVIDYISQKAVCDTITLIKSACEAMVMEGFSHPTSFEIETAMTMLYFMWEKVDFAILEVGLGGRLDATNVISHPFCCIITSISMDHMQILGDTLELIAKEKAGIIKKGSTVISYEQEPEVTRVLQQTCQEQEASFAMVDFSVIKKVNHSLEQIIFTTVIEGLEQTYCIKLLGENQVKNAVLAIHAVKLLEILGVQIGDENIHKGLMNTSWSGRFEVVARKPYVIIDGAHNENAAKSLSESIKLYFTNQRIIFIMGVLADKDYKSILQNTASLADVIITLTPNNSRALSSAVLAKEAKHYCNHVLDAGDEAQALQLAFKEAGEEDVIIAFGSLSYLGDLVGGLSVKEEPLHT